MQSLKKIYPLLSLLFITAHSYGALQPYGTQSALSTSQKRVLVAGARAAITGVQCALNPLGLITSRRPGKKTCMPFGLRQCSAEASATSQPQIAPIPTVPLSAPDISENPLLKSVSSLATLRNAAFLGGGLAVWVTYSTVKTFLGGASRADGERVRDEATKLQKQAAEVLSKATTAASALDTAQAAQLNDIQNTQKSFENEAKARMEALNELAQAVNALEDPLDKLSRRINVNLIMSKIIAIDSALPPEQRISYMFNLYAKNNDQTFENVISGWINGTIKADDILNTSQKNQRVVDVSGLVLANNNLPVVR